MSRRRPVLILAMLAALLGAPSSVFAAAPNELRGADVSPRGGWLTTPFVFSVDYRSSAGNPAESVSAAVAGTDVPLVLVSGTLVDGRWSGTALLPVGKWMVTFRAGVANGRQPSLAFGTVTVAATSAAPPSDTSAPISPADNPALDSGGPTWQPAPQATDTPRPSSQPAASSRTPRPSARAAPAGDGGASARPGSRERPSASHARRGSAKPSATPAGASGMRRRASEAAASARSDDPETPQSLPLSLLLGLSAVGLMALVGTAWALLAARRRQEVGQVEAPAEAHEPDIALPAIATMEKRALRRARLRQADDPIIAGMGLDDETPRTASPRRPPGGRRPR